MSRSQVPFKLWWNKGTSDSKLRPWQSKLRVWTTAFFGSHPSLALDEWSCFVVQLLSFVWLFVTPWTAACQTPLFSIISWSLLKFMSIELVMLYISSCVIPFSYHLQSFPASGSFQMSQFFASGGQSIGVSASASVLPMNIQDWFPLGWTGWISLKSKGLSRISSKTTVQKHKFFKDQPSL